MQKLFETTDLYLAAAISIFAAITPELKIINHKVIFVFPASDEVYKVINEYDTGAMVKAVHFASVVKNLESQALSIRNNVGLWDWD